MKLPQLPRPFCTQYNHGMCTHPRAWIMWGSRLPSPDQCRRCGFRDGPRGIGDVVASIISWTPWGRQKQAAGCGPCKARQEALNRAMPFGGAGNPPGSPAKPSEPPVPPSGPSDAPPPQTGV